MTGKLAADSPHTGTGERRNIILKEAAALIREKGYSGTTLRELAKRSGIKGGSVYHHFASKQDILFRIMEDSMVGLINRVKAQTDSAGTPADRLAEAVRAHIVHHTVEPDETYITDAELRSLNLENYQIIVRMRDQYENLYVRIMQEGIAQGQMEIRHVNLAVKAMLQACTGVSHWFNPAGPLTIEAVAEQYIAVFFHGIINSKGEQHHGNFEKR